jgi:uncharacterized protein YPO0396
MRIVLALLMVWEASSAFADERTYGRPAPTSELLSHIQLNAEQGTQSVIERLKEIEYLKSAMIFCASRRAAISWEAMHDLLSAKIQDLEATFIAEHAEITPRLLEDVAQYATTKRDQILKQIDTQFDEPPGAKSQNLVLRVPDYDNYCRNTITSALRLIK